MSAEAKKTTDDNNDVAATEPEAVTSAIPEGYVEEKVQVDRKRLESMITGMNSESLPNAHFFFSQIENTTGTKISWPTQLKIGAKTKKDPFVKILGPPRCVNQARDAIMKLLKVRKDRLTLRIEISHASHSHIIGKAGRNVQKIMRETNCHIHFPDSNKYNDVEKKNQVSISGNVIQVDHARIMLRSITPVILIAKVEIKNKSPVNTTEIQRLLSSTDIQINVTASGANEIQLAVRGSIQQERVVVGKVNQFLSYISNLGHKAETVFVHSFFYVRPSLFSRTFSNAGTISRISTETKTQISILPEFLLIVGGATNIFVAHRFLTGLLPVSILFEKPQNSLPTNKHHVKWIETKFNVTIGEKKKNNGTANDLNVIWSYEANIHNVFSAYQQFISIDHGGGVPHLEMKGNSEDIVIQELVKKLSVVTSPSVFGDSSFVPMHLGDSSNFGNSNNFDFFNRSPPLTESPPMVAQGSTLQLYASGNGPTPSNTGISLVQDNSWKAPGMERQIAINRDKMLLKANKATYGHEVSKIRHPTDLWSGYGFSNSLPADILKLGLKKIWEPDESEEEKFSATSTIDRETKQVTPRGQVVNEQYGTQGPSLPGNIKHLASVLEEEELSDYNCSSSNFSSPSQTTKEPMPMIMRKQGFAASASVFEAAMSLGNDITWDISFFEDPAMVLAQLSCSEYLPQFRDQEIDMQAFLLLDEHNLKEIGVSTMGARKKIFNAILKLRESAREHGMTL